MTENMNRINKLFEELVPASGHAETVAGELVRATARLGYRFMNDGDQIGIEYGRETCNPAARYLLAKGSDPIENQIADMWEIYSEEAYEKKLDNLCGLVADYIESHPELKSQENNEDFWDYRDDCEDVDWEEEEEEEEW